jgi:uncharacterized caspase-like protein
MKFRALTIASLLVFLATPGMAEGIALVMTGETYANAGSLKNPKNDGVAFRKLLEELGFSVMMTSDADLETMRNAINDISEEAEEVDDILVFFAGHGISFEAESRLLPIDAELDSRSALMKSSIPLRDLLIAVGKAKRLGMVFSDACRNDPFLSSGADGSRSVRVLSDGFMVDPGLVLPDEDEIASLEAVATGGGTYIVGLSTSAGHVASDGRGLNSPFTTALIRALQASRSADEIGNAVSTDVSAATNGRQRPIFKIWRHQ